MNDPFAVDITIGTALFHVRAMTAAELANNVLLARALFPAIATAPELATVHGAQSSGLRTAATTAPRPIQAAPPPAPRLQADAMPVCPVSGTAKPSKFYAGLFCPKTHGDARCQWSHKCTDTCSHAAA